MMKVAEETAQELRDLADKVKRLRDLSYGVVVVHAREDKLLDKSAETVKRLSDVLWREATDLCTAVDHFNRDQE